MGKYLVPKEIRDLRPQGTLVKRSEMDIMCTNAHPPRKKCCRKMEALSGRLRIKWVRAQEKSPLKMVLFQMPSASWKRKSRFWTMAIKRFQN